MFHATFNAFVVSVRNASDSYRMAAALVEWTIFPSTVISENFQASVSETKYGWKQTKIEMVFIQADAACN
jgi:hypothetical protein